MWVPIMEQRQEQAVLERDHAEVLKKLGSLKTRPWGLIIGVNVTALASKYSQNFRIFLYNCSFRTYRYV